jgi:5-methylcytosine-specific restriction endonuclease McrA
LYALFAAADASPSSSSSIVGGCIVGRGGRERRERKTGLNQYCGQTKRSVLTIDHVIPISKGGDTSYDNCITACYSCNNKKNNKLLSETNMRLINEPQNPIYDIYYGLYPSRKQHPDWKMFLK